jgi:hypothetical protein
MVEERKAIDGEFTRRRANRKRIQELMLDPVRRAKLHRERRPRRRPAAASAAVGAAPADFRR